MVSINQIDIDWQALRRLRQHYTEASQHLQADYWQRPEILFSYDATLGARIGWKWQAVLQELASLIELPDHYQLLDWGCGTGVASRQWLAHFSRPQRLFLHDRSAAAMNFASDAAVKANPGLSIESLPKLSSDRTAGMDVILISHVMTELNSATLQSLQKQLTDFSCVVWVDAGTHEVSHRLIEVREFLRSEGYEILAPCQHQDACGLAGQSDRSSDWCHFFADPPAEAFTSSYWRQVSQELGIDLRALPLSYLVARRPQGDVKRAQPKRALEWRVIGRIRRFKGFCQAQVCKPGEVCEMKLQKRDFKRDFKQWSTTAFDRFWPKID